MQKVDEIKIEVPEKCRFTGTATGTAVIYARTDSKTEPEEDLHRQAEKCFDFCAKHRLAVLCVVADQCEKTERSRELDRAVSLCCEYQVTYLIIDRLSRVAIDLTDIEVLENALMGRGTTVLPIQFQAETKNELSLYDRIAGALRTKEKKGASERTKLGMQRATERGKICHRVPAGIIVKKQKTTLEYDPIRAPLIRMGFFMLFSQMFSIADIAKMLGKRGLVNEKTGKPYTARTMKRILSNPIYAGEMPGPDRYFFRPEGLNPLIEKIIFDEVQKILKEAKDNPLRTRHRPSSGESGDEWLAAVMGM